MKDAQCLFLLKMYEQAQAQGAAGQQVLTWLLPVQEHPMMQLIMQMM